MDRYKLTSILTLGCLIILVMSVTAQQPATGKSRSPMLTSDDVARGRNTGAVVVLNAIDTQNWTRHNPPGLRLSLELPGGVDLREAGIPGYEINAPQNVYKNAKLYIGASTSLQVNLLYIPGNKLSASQADLREIAAAIVKAISTRIDPRARYSTQLIDKSTVSVKASMTAARGMIFEMMGSMQSKGGEMCLVTSTFLQSDEAARTAARRITNSAKFD